MKLNRPTMIAAALAIAFAAYASAESGKPRHGHRPPPNPILEALDVNHDHALSADEIANAPAVLKTLDKNNDGQLDETELLPPPPSGADFPPPPSDEE